MHSSENYEWTNEIWRRNANVYWKMLKKQKQLRWIKSTKRKKHWSKDKRTFKLLAQVLRKSEKKSIN